MKFVLLSILAAIPLIVAQPYRNDSRTFCHGLPHGFYCNPADALHIVECPGGHRVRCPTNKFCASVGRVPDCYRCEAGFDEVKFCDKRGVGSYCAPDWAGSTSVWSCPDGREHPCPHGSKCKRLSKYVAMCAPIPRQKMNKAEEHCGRHTVTSRTICDCTSITRSPTSTVTIYDLTVTSVSVSTSVCGGRSTSTSSVTDVSLFTSYTLTIDITTTITNTVTDFFQSTTTVISTDLTTSFSTIGQVPAFVCLASSTFTNVVFDTDIQTICLTGTLDVDCAVSTTNNIGESFCQSFILPTVAGP